MVDAELENLRKQCISKLYICTENVYKYLDEDKDEKLTSLKSYLERYCLHEAEQNVLREVCEKTKNQSNISNMNTINERFDKHLKDMTKKVKVENHPHMIELKNIIQKWENVEEENLDESEVAITNTNEAFIDPITKRVIQDPVRNSMCGHIYERDSIIAHIKSQKKKRLCPVMGCGNTQSVLEKHLIPDEDIRIKLTQMSIQNIPTDAEAIDESMDTL